MPYVMSRGVRTGCRDTTPFKDRTKHSSFVFRYEFKTEKLNRCLFFGVLVFCFSILIKETSCFFVFFVFSGLVLKRNNERSNHTRIGAAQQAVNTTSDIFSPYKVVVFTMLVNRCSFK